jgi:sec-independent protein translocase protein TatC
VAARKRGADGEVRMSLGEHLIELRNRLFIAAGAIVAGAVGGWFLVDWVKATMRIPLEKIAEERQATMMYTTVSGAFDLEIQIAFTIGIVISSPIWLYQIFAFLVPGLTKREKQYTFGFFFAAVPLFLAGGYTGWTLFPRTVLLLANFSSAEEATNLDAKYYYDFVIKFVLAVGVGYVLPVFVVLLNFLGILSATSILKGWRIAILVITIFTALATPAGDLITMILLAVPMTVLYFAAAGVAWLHDRAVVKRVDAIDAELATQ